MVAAVPTHWTVPMVLPVNPFGAPPAEPPREVPYDGTAEEARYLRERYLARETTLRGLGLIKLATAAVALGVAIWLAVEGKSAAELADRRGLYLGVDVPALALGAVALFFALVHLALGLGLWFLRDWARWGQMIISLGVGMYCLVVMANDALGEGLGTFGGMLAGSTQVILLMVLFSRPAGEICSYEYREIRTLTPEIRTAGLIAFKFGLLLVVWAFGELGLAITLLSY